jgi:hypothetical protein
LKYSVIQSFMTEPVAAGKRMMPLELYRLNPDWFPNPRCGSVENASSVMQALLSQWYMGRLRGVINPDNKLMLRGALCDICQG